MHIEVCVFYLYVVYNNILVRGVQDFTSQQFGIRITQTKVLNTGGETKRYFFWGQRKTPKLPQDVKIINFFFSKLPVTVRHRPPYCRRLGQTYHVSRAANHCRDVATILMMSLPPAMTRSRVTCRRQRGDGEEFRW